MRYLDSTKEPDTLLNTIDEVGIFKMGNAKSVVLKSLGANNLTDYLFANSSNPTEYQGYDIRKLNQADFLTQQLDPIVQNFEGNFYVILENYFVFAEEQEALKTVVANKTSGTTFDSSPSYLNAREFLPLESSLFLHPKRVVFQIF